MTNFWTVVYFHIIMTLLLLLVVHQLCFPVYIWGWRRRSLWPVVGLVGCRTWRFWALSLWKLQMKKMAGFPYSSTTMTRREPNYRCVRDNTACQGLSMYFEGKVVDRLVFLEKNTAPSVTFRFQKSFVLPVWLTLFYLFFRLILMLIKSCSPTSPWSVWKTRTSPSLSTLIWGCWNGGYRAQMSPSFL